MMRFLKNRWLLCWVLCVLGSNAVQAQLPSLFGNDGVENELSNTVLKPGDDPQEKIRSQIFIKTTLSKKSCFVGEPVLVLYQLYTALYCQPRVIKQPSFSGCSLVEMTTDEPEYLDQENGKMYRVLLIRKVQLTPLQEGELLIPPAVVNNEVGFTSTENPYRMKNYQAAVSSRPDSIHVKPLPSNKPADYSGIAGGNFSISAKVDSTTLPQGENDLLQITIAGEGNIDAIGLPVVQWPKGIEHFESTDSQHVNKLNFPVRGNKTFAIPFVGTQQGQKTIPAVSFTFFNTASQQFETVRTQPITLQVVGALPARQLDKLLEAGTSDNKKYLWFVPGIAIVVISVWLISNKKKEQKAEAANSNLPHPPAAAPEDRPAGRQAAVPVAENVSDQMPETNTVNVSAPAAAAPDFERLLQALSQTDDHRIFFTNAKTWLTALLQHTLGSTAQDENEVLQLASAKDEVMAANARHIYAACNQHLYSPVIEDHAREKLMEQLQALLRQSTKL